jgi:hypothetical protein
VGVLDGYASPARDCAGIFNHSQSGFSAKRISTRLAFKGIKMMITVSLWIAPLHLGINQTLPDHLLGDLFVIRLFFFFFFAGHTNGLMIINRQNSLVICPHLFIAPGASYRTV